MFLIVTYRDILGKKILKKKIGKLFYLMTEIFDCVPFEENLLKFYETKKNLTNHFINFDIPKYLIHEISLNMVPSEIYAPICTLY